MKQQIKHTDLVIINDNNLGFLGGERESQLIIINAVRKVMPISVIQPGEFGETIDNVSFYWRTKAKRMKSLIKNPFAFIGYIFKISKLINEINPKIVHSNSQVSFFMITLAKRLHLIPQKIKIIHTDRGLYTKYSCFFRRLFQYSFKKTDMLITTTYFNENCWKEANDIKKIKLKYKVIENTAGSIYEAIDESKLSNNDYLTIGFAGRMCDWKGWPLAENICKSLPKESNYHFKMYISCLDDDAKKEAEQLFARMNECFGENFVGRINVPFSEMEQFYYDCDIYILTSWPKSESFGRTIVESMSRKTAVLTTNAGGSVEVVNDADTVCNVTEDFVNKIEEWNSNRALLAQTKEKNFARVRAEYTLKKNTTKYLDLYESLIQGIE